jgi:hypothetical protein
VRCCQFVTVFLRILPSRSQLLLSVLLVALR